TFSTTAGVAKTLEPLANIAGSFSLVDRSRITAIDQASSLGQTIVETSSSCSEVFCSWLRSAAVLLVGAAGTMGAQPEQKTLRFTPASPLLSCGFCVSMCADGRRIAMRDGSPTR